MEWNLFLKFFFYPEYYKENLSRWQLFIFKLFDYNEDSLVSFADLNEIKMLNACELCPIFTQLYNNLDNYVNNKSTIPNSTYEPCSFNNFKMISVKTPFEAFINPIKETLLNYQIQREKYLNNENGC